MTFLLRRFLVISTLLCAVTTTSSATPNEGAIVNKIQKFYDSTKDLHAKFEQTLTSGTGGRKRASGDLWLKKPGRMRWDYVKPEKKIMVSDGRVLWVYEPEDEQAFKQDLRSSSLPVSVSFLLGEGKLSDDFHVELAPKGDEKPGEVALKLVPKAPTSAYRYLLFIVDEQTGQVRRTIIYDQQGGTNELVFSNVESNRGVNDSKFQFSPPRGTRILNPKP
jgi:outer membrane lipoprotein carrier protein